MNLRSLFDFKGRKNRVRFCPKCGSVIFESDRIGKKECACYNCYSTFPRIIFDYKSIRVRYKGKEFSGKNPIKIRWRKKQNQKRRKKKPQRSNRQIRHVNVGARFLASQRGSYIIQDSDLDDLTPPVFCWTT